MKTTLKFTAIAFGVAISTQSFANVSVDANVLWTYKNNTNGVAEIAAYESTSARVFVVDPENDALDIIDFNTGAKIGSLAVGGTPNSVAAKNGIIAVAVEGATKQDLGSVEFYDTLGNFQNSVTVGALPDSLAFSPDGKKIVVANEGEPDASYTNDPEGTISVIDISGGVNVATVTSIGLISANPAQAAIEETALIAKGVRIFGPNATAAQDLEPEFVTIDNQNRAWVTLQENNAIAEIDLNTNTVTEIHALGTKDHSVAGNGFDASNHDGIDGNIQTHPTQGMYQPDAIDNFEVNGKTYLITANEGDARDYAGFSEEARVKDLILDPTAFPDLSLQDDDQLGRLKTTTANGDTDNDGDVDTIFSYGARSFSILDDEGNLVFDSGDDLEQQILANAPELWQDGRSDDKGPEPEAVVVGELDGMLIAVIGAERTSTLHIYEISDPTNPVFLSLIFNEGDISPEGLVYIDELDILLVANEVSGTTTAYGITAVPLPAGFWMLASGALGLFRLSRRK